MTLTDARLALKKYFGYDSFRPMQAEIIEKVYEKKDTVVLMPTGGGKSVCYQIPAVTLDGVCIVVSPLISLMKDQVEGLQANGINAAFMNSSLTGKQLQEVENELYHGQLKLLYVSPEKLVSQSFLNMMRQANISLFAIDEAHCISSWGHDFRPEYTKMKFLKATFPGVPIMALTATADKATRKDITKQLGLRKAKVFIASFDRPNLSLIVRPGQKRMQQMYAFLEKRKNQAGIVYCLSRKNTERVAEALNGYGVKAMYYHAGMPSEARSKVQEDFINDKIQIVCATVAFGMGIDKSNVRFVIHYNLPKNVESYYQEIGRAGRDGAEADTLLFWSYQDVKVMRDILSDDENGNHKNSELKLAKLERMRQYAEALQCRRKILLNYFSENLVEDCGNCDVCNNPPEYFDGTVISQKALSAIARTNEAVGINMAIDILRGSNKKEIYHFEYNKIKTYGAGKDISWIDWQNYFSQLLNLGLVEIAYDDNQTLKLTPAAKEVLFNGKKVEMVKAIDLKKRQDEEKAKVKVKPERERVRDELFESLRQLRLRVARTRGVPPYLIFSDATLEEMAAMRPVSDLEMSKISGVGERKLHLYGDQFKEVILDFIKDQTAKGVKIGNSTYMVTLDLYQKGAKVEDIAAKRNLAPKTVLSHLVKLYEIGENVDLSPFAAQHEIDHILTALPHMEPPYKMRPIFDFFDEKIPYEKIQIAMAHYYRNATVGSGK